MPPKPTKTRVQFFQYGELPLVLLAVLATGPRHGSELMHELGRLFGPAYTPSAGSVYPAVSALEAEGLIESEANGARRSYRLTPAGETALDERRGLLAEIEIRTGVRVGPSGDLTDAVERFARRVAALNGHVEPALVERELDRAITRLEALRDHG